MSLLCRLKQKQIPILYSLTAFCILFLFLVLSEEKGKRIRLLVDNNQSEKLATIDQEVEENFVSFCSLDADRRGPHQNVIAYSLYGNFSNLKHFARYIDPSMKLILANISQAYPGN